MSKTKKQKIPTKLVYGIIVTGYCEEDGYTLCFIEKEHALYLKNLGEILNSSQTWGEFLCKAPAEELDCLRDWIINNNPEADRPFETGDIDICCDGDWPEWPIKSMLDWMPPDIVNKYGEIGRTMLNGDFLTINTDFEVQVVAALQKHGYIVEKNNELVRRAQAVDPGHYCNQDYPALYEQVHLEVITEEGLEVSEKEVADTLWNGSQAFSNVCDQVLFQKDLLNLLSSKCCENRTLLVDDLFVRLKFNIPKDDRIHIFPITACIKLVKLDPDAYLLLTTSFITNRSYIRDRDEVISCRDMLSGCAHYHIAEANSNFCQYYTNPDTECRLDRYFRICYYAVEGPTNSMWRLLRFENGKVIDEGNLQPGEELHDKANYSGPAEYRADLSAMNAGLIPLSWCHAAASTMSKYGVDFATACDIMKNKGVYSDIDGVIIHNLAVEI